MILWTSKLSKLSSTTEVKVLNINIRETCYLISKDVHNDGFEITRKAQDMNMKGQLERGRYLYFLFTKFSIAS